jgi:hypothetical protein
MALVHAVTVFLSAFLLFQVQPLLSKWILPWYGGGPAIWTTCLVFFQTALFAGYAYAHLSRRYLPRSLRLLLHLALAAAALFVPLAPLPPAGLDPPALSILRLLAVHVGLPFFLLSTTGPLVQAWSARAFPERSPYRLYALSNIGSLAALLTYPFLVEPRWGLRAQSTFWTWALRVFVVLTSAGALGAWRRDGAPAPAAPEEEPAPGPGRRALWVLLPAFASGMLVASTNQLCQDVAVLPFLWVLPLAAYLGSFILTFDHPRWYQPAWIAPLAVAAAFAAAITDRLSAITPAMTVLRVAVLLVSMAAVCMLCHGELSRLKPGPRFLTSYYLAMSGGGALGGAFVSLVAPQIWSSFFEWKLGIGAAYLAAWGLLFRIQRARLRAHLNIAALLVVLAFLGFAFLAASFDSGPRLDVARNFYGVVRVVSRGEGDDAVRDFIHGRILHGREYLRGPHHGRPTAYYVERSGVGRAIAFFRSRPDLRVGVVGLGVGTIAAYAEAPSQSFRFYEINPEVVRMARTQFRTLEECAGKVEVVPGDARLSMEREAPQRYHVLALDAFSGDTIPTHLLTAEAMTVYTRHLEPDGVLAVHISNHYLDLAPVVRGMAERAGMKTAVLEYDQDETGAKQISRWMLCSRHEAALGEAGARAPDDAREILWTDDASDLFSIFKLR